MDDLQEKIIEALYEAPESLVAESAFGALAHNKAIQRARKRAKAVMGVVELHLAELEAERDLLQRKLDTAEATSPAPTPPPAT